jgi:outer membrane PBP1 activator LpoA protein
MPVLTRLTACRNAVILLLLVTLIQACSVSGPQAPTATLSPLHQKAAALEARGDYQGAARLFLQAASHSTSNEKHALELLAADSLIRDTDYPGATKILEALPVSRLNLINLQHYDVNRAKIAVREQHPDTALAILQVVPLSGPFVTDIHRLRAEAYLQNNRFFSSARERILLDPLLTDPDKQLENEFLIWEALNSLTDVELQDLRSAPPPDPVSGWIELVELARLYLQQPDVLKEVTPHWQKRYPGHPASQSFIDQLLGTMQVAGQPPAHMALLLPLTGSFSDAASAIRDGLFAAYYDSPDSAMHPQVRLYDTGETTESVLTAYQQAVAEGAQFIIGPLRKEAVQAVAMQEELPVPVLALNHAQNPPLSRDGLYQFGLSPEDEAREVARMAWRDGHYRSIAMIPANDWGERVYAAFAIEWQTLGGEILEVQRYDTSKTDHGEAISTSLNLDSSKARHKQISRLLGQTLEFEPRRRKDVDFVFLLASPRQARLIRPQLSFYRASTVPVYSTSQVFTGNPDKGRDIDLNGIVFCDMPWTLEHDSSWEHLQTAINTYWPENAGRYKRLYALGIDAYRVVPYLSQLGGGMFGTYHGVSGNLSLDSHGQINRTLRCAKFHKGLPSLLEPVAAQAVATNPDMR